MNHKSLLVVAFKIAAVFLLIDITETLPSQLTSMEPVDGFDQSRVIWLTIVLPAFIKLIVASMFWFFPNSLIGLTVPNADSLDVFDKSHEGLTGALITAVGVYLFCYGLSDLAYFVALKNEMSLQFGAQLQPSDHAALVATIVQVAIGFLLVVGNKGLSKLVQKVRQ